MLPFNQLSIWELETYFRNIDYLILGSGIVGLSTAIELRKKSPKSKIVILERGYLPTGASTKNAGFACFGGASEIVDDLSLMDEKTVVQTLQYRWEGLSILRERLGDDVIEFDSCGSVDLFRSSEKTTYLNVEEKIPFLNKLVGEITQIKGEIYSVKENTFGFSDVPYLIENKYDGKINTGKMMKSLVELAISQGVIILNGIDVQNVDFSGTNKQLITNFGAVSAKNILFCTNGLSKKFFPNLDIQPARAQVILTAPIPTLSWNGTFHYDKGYYYFRNIGNRILLGGARNKDKIGETTEDIATTNFILDELKLMLNDVILPNSIVEIEHQWAGIMGVGNEKLPIVSELENNVFCAIRLGGMGVAMGSKVGKNLANLVLES
jgi:glycine/D-amino acid oxidase-like deaminating enzyme